MKDKKNKYSGIITAVLFFLFSLYLTEISPFGSHSAAMHNGGYGVFDMNR
ncbi:MAG: hypothetical protein Q4F95_09980 [Oscillospiraceae bacterium]|nr:hypothetical protein [Oscillospiraceae bacterium]